MARRRAFSCVRILRRAHSAAQGALMRRSPRASRPDGHSRRDRLSLVTAGRLRKCSISFAPKSWSSQKAWSYSCYHITVAVIPPPPSPPSPPSSCTALLLLLLLSPVSRSRACDVLKLSEATPSQTYLSITIVEYYAERYV